MDLEQKIARTVESTAIVHLKPNARNARTHSKKQIRQIADSIRTFGFTNPVLISDEDEIIAGHGRVEAAKLLGIQSVPTVRLSHLDATQRRAYGLTDNKLALNGGWDATTLKIEMQSLIEVDFDVELTGFSLAELNLYLCPQPTSSRKRGRKTKSEPALAPQGRSRSVGMCGSLAVIG